MNEVGAWRGLRAPRSPERRLAIVGIGLAELIVDQVALPVVRRRYLGLKGQLNARLVERSARLHDFGAEPDQLVARLWLWQNGREVRQFEGTTIARRGVDRDGDLRLGRTHGDALIVQAEETHGREDGNNLGFHLDDSDGPQQAGAERAA